MRPIILILLFFISLNAFSEGIGDYDWDCSEANKKCSFQQSQNSKAGLSSSCSRAEHDNSYVSIDMKINGNVFNMYLCDRREKVCEEGKPFEGWFPPDSISANPVVCDGRCKVTKSGDPVPGTNSDGVSAVKVTGTTMAEPCDDPMKDPIPIPNFEPDEPKCPTDWTPGKCDDAPVDRDQEYSCTEIQIDTDKYCRYVEWLDPCRSEADDPHPNCTPPGEDSPLPDPLDPDGKPIDPDNPLPDNPDNPTDGDGTTPGGGGIPGGTGGTGGTGGADSNATGKEPNEEGTCDDNYIYTMDLQGKFYCRPPGTTDKNSDGTCPLDFKPSPVDNRFCIPEVPGDGDDSDGDGKPDSSDGCSEGWSWNITEKKCVPEVDLDVDKGKKHKPATLFDICKQNPKLLTPSTLAYCQANLPAQQTKDKKYLDDVFTGFEDYFKEGTKALEPPDLKIEELYAGLFKPFEALLSKRPECPIMQDVDLPSVDFFGSTIDFKAMFPKEGFIVPCDLFELMRIMFLLTVIYFGFRLIFKAVVGV